MHELRSIDRTKRRTAGARRRAPQMMRVHGALAAALAATATLAGCTIDSSWSRGSVEPLPSDLTVELAAATDCDSLVDAARPSLEAAVDSTWPQDSGGSWTDSLPWSGSDDAVESFESDGAARSPIATTTPSPGGTAGREAMDQAIGGDAAADTTAGAGTTAESGAVIGTNNQEQGVDESDLVKTDGRLLVSVVNGQLRVVQLDGTPAIDGVLDLSSRGATDLFLRGDSALVLGTLYGNGQYGPAYEGPAASGAPGEADVFEDGVTTSSAVVPSPPPFTTATTLTLVSLVDPAAPTITASADAEGQLVTARDHGGRARVVLRSDAAVMEDVWSATSRDAAVQAVDAVSADDLLPRLATDGRVSAIGDCSDVMVAGSPVVADDSFSPSPQLSTVTVLTVGDDLTDLAPVSVQGTADTVYASTGALYIASASWDEAGSRTDLHRLDLTGSGPATYSGSGKVPGTMVDQFAMSERDGMLRVVTTTQSLSTEPMREIGPEVDVALAPTSEARLSVLDTDGTLDEVASLDGMGIGEQVQSVRFLDDIAYLVTFRQVDPLYAVDLSDPRAPRLLGELKIPGFSEYLHPVGSGLLLGVGRQVDPTSGVDQGLKISLFDMADPTRPAEVDQIVLPGTRSEVSDDHRAFLWDPNRHQAVIPTEFSGCDEFSDCTNTPGGAALVVRADGSGLSEIGRISHDTVQGWSLQPTRSVVAGDDLWTVSIAALGLSDADSPTTVQLLPF